MVKDERITRWHKKRFSVYAVVGVMVQILIAIVAVILAPVILTVAVLVVLPAALWGPSENNPDKCTKT